MNEVGTTEILSYNPQCTQPVGSVTEQEIDFATPQVQSNGTIYAPKWNHPKCGARFGFGGRLVSFQGKCLKVHSQVLHSKEKEVAAKVQELDAHLQQAMNSGTLSAFLDAKAHEEPN